MKNDFDFIKEKIENSGVNAPDNMNEDYVLTRLEGVTPDLSSEAKVVEFKPKKRRTALISGLAAAFVAMVALSVFGIIRMNQNTKPAVKDTAVPPTLSADIPLRTFNSYDEVREQMKTVSSRYQVADEYRYSGEKVFSENLSADSLASSGSSAGSSGASSAGGSEAHSETYKQVEGVDEADIVKTDGRYLYVLTYDDSECVRIYSATDAPEQVAVIYPNSMENPSATPDKAKYDEDHTVFPNEMFLNGDKLIVVTSFYNKDSDHGAKALVYDISDIGNIRLVDQFTQSGEYRSSRMIGDRLYMISGYYVYDDEFRIPVCYGGADAKDIPIDCVCSVEKPANNDMIIIGGYSLSDGSGDVQSSAIIGSISDAYCNEDNMYLYTTEWNDYYFASTYGIYEQDSSGSDIVPQFEPIKTGIYKISLKDGISFTAYGQIEGTIYDRYALDEKDGYLRVSATTTDKNYVDSNVLYVLDSDLKEVGRVDDFAKDESIKAVRYVGDTAYVITYEQTDPLFVIDLSDVNHPTILGEVKIDGFSSMLVPVDENTVLGLGYYTEDADYTDMQVQRGFKLALFDVSDKMNPKVLDEKIYRNYYSPVMYETRALVYNPDRGDYVIPLNFEDYHLDDEVDYYMPTLRGGMLNFKVEDGKLVETAHETVDTESITRCLYVGDNVYMISTGEYYGDGKTEVFAVKYR